MKTLKYIWNHPLASRERFRALRRYFGWQLSSRLIKCPIVLPFVENTVLVTETSMTGATGNYYCGLHEFEDMAFLLHFLRKDDLFIDVGANVGSYTVLASGVVGARSLAFEPVPNTFERLQRNIRTNKIDGLAEAKRLAIGSSQGEIHFSTDNDTVNKVVSTDYVGSSEKVPVSSLDVLLEGLAPLMWKVDVEGFEIEVLKGSRSALRQESLQAILLECQSPEVNSLVTDAGFRKAAYEPFSRDLTVIDDEKAGRSANQLWVRDHNLVAQRCKTSRKFCVNNIQL